MLHFERQVTEKELIAAMLDMFDICNIGMFDTDGYPYVVPVNFGYEMTDTHLNIYVHFAKRGHKLDLMRLNPHVCATFAVFNDFPDMRFKGHHHDYRSVIAKGIMHIVDAKEDYDEFEKGYNLMYTCNHRDIVPLSSRKVIPGIYIGKIVCDLENVTAKSEFPLRKVEDVPFMNVYEQEYDETPFDISDTIAKRKAEMKK